MKTILMIGLTAALLASCSPKTESGTTTDSATTTTDTATDSVVTDTTGTDTTATETMDSDTATESGTTDDGTLANADDANISEEVDMAAGDGLEGTVTEFDATAQTFTLNENDANYAVTVSDSTVFEGAATTAEEFFASDRADATVAVEGQISEGQSELVATKITLQ